MLLASGMSIWNDMIQEIVDKQAKKQSTSGGTSKEVTKHVMPAWAKESAANYERWMASVGMGSAALVQGK